MFFSILCMICWLVFLFMWVSSRLVSNLCRLFLDLYLFSVVWNFLCLCLVVEWRCSIRCFGVLICCFCRVLWVFLVIG